MSITLKAMPFDSEVNINPSTGQEEYDRVANAEDLAELIRAYFSNGILVRGTDLLTNELQVLYLSAMNCVVKPGMIIINGRTGILPTQQTITFDVGESNPRIDRVIAELNAAERNVYIKILKGTAAASPAVPAVTQTEDIYQIPLAQVRVNASQSVIYSVTDERASNISNVLLNQKASEGINATTVSISETIRVLYGLSVDNMNVSAALQKIMQGGLLSGPLTGYSKTTDTGSIVATDTLLKALSRLENSKAQIVQGTYTGDGTATRTISLAFTPKLVVIFGSNSHIFFKTNGRSYEQVLALYGATNTTYGTTTNGFLVSSNDKTSMTGTASNDSGAPYSYVAIG